MTLVVPWLVFPLVLGLVCLGCGLLVERLSRVNLPAPLLLPTGFAAVVVAAGYTTATSATAQFTVPLVVSLAIAGYGVSLPWRRRALHGWGFAAAGAAYAAFAAPVVLSGSATIAGYIKLDDTATWLALTDRALEHGRSLAGLAPSSYSVVLNDYLAHGYPLGTFLPLGVGHALVGTDAAWLFDPYLAFVGALLALSAYALVSRAVRDDRLRAAVAFIGCQPALLYAYTLWGGAKEIVGAALLTVTAALVVPALRSASVSAVVPLALASAAVLNALSLGGIVWLGPLLVPSFAVLLFASRANALRSAAAYAVVALVCAVPALTSASSFIHATSSNSVLTKNTELGNLFHPLSKLQVLGIWPTGDFRTTPGHYTITRLVLLVLAGALAIGLAVSVRRRAWELVFYAVGLAVGCAVVVRFGSPWVDGKALATAGPAFVVVAMAGAAALFERRRRLLALAFAVVIAGGVVWSNALAYHDVTLAPRGQLAELAQIGSQFRGAGPTLIDEHASYAVRHFLRDMDAESPSERRARPIDLRSGGVMPPGQSTDIDDYRLDAVLVYPTLVLRRAATSSRPPSVYQLVRAGRYFDVWQKPAAGATVVEHLSLGRRYEPAAVPLCADVLRLAAEAGPNGRLATVIRRNPTVLELASVPYTTSPGTYTEDPRVDYLRKKVTLTYSLLVGSNGRYLVWIGGTFVSNLTLIVDGKTVGSRRDELNWPGQFTPLGSVQLLQGAHVVALKYSGPDVLHPGSGGRPQFGTGPLVFSRTTENLPVTFVDPSRARSLCGKTLDWVEALRG